MTKVLDCADLTGECDFRATGETVEEVLQRAAAHAKNAHDLEVSAEFVAKVRAAIRDQDA